MSWFSRLANVFRTRRLDRDLNDELEFHLEARAEDLLQQGYSPDEAARQARRGFGNPLAYRESSRDIRLLPWLESLVQDARFGLRALRKERPATVAALFTLSLAIGACTAAFSLIDALLLRPLSLPDPQSLVERSYPRLHLPFPGAPADDYRFSYPLFEQFRAAARDQADLFALTLGTPLQSAVFDDTADEVERVRAQWISGGAFGILGVRPEIGRLFIEREDRAETAEVAVLSYLFWLRRFGGDRSVIGRWMKWNGKPFRIIGVAEKSFSGIEPGTLTDLWLPLKTWASAGQFMDPSANLVNIWGRRKVGQDLPLVQQSLQATFTNFRREYVRTLLRPGTPSAEVARYRRTPLDLKPAPHGHQTFVAWEFERPLWFLAIVVGLVLVASCSNLMNLFLARAAARSREMAMRAAIGAGRRRLVQQVLIESSLLTAAAGLVGLVLASVAAPAIVGLLGRAEDPLYLALHTDGRVLAFAALIGLLAIVLFGMAPALRASGVGPGEVLKAGGGSPARIRILKPALAVQVGFSFAVVFVAGLLLLSFQKLTSSDLGFSADRVVLFTLDRLPSGQGEKHRAVVRELLDRLRHFPGVQSAATSLLPLVGGAYFPHISPFIKVPGREHDSVRPLSLAVSPGFFATMQIRLLAGREFSERDTEPTRPSAVVVNQSFARYYFPGADPVGKRFESIDDDGAAIREIIGVVRDARYNNLREAPAPTFYEPAKGIGSTVEVRTAGNPLTIATALRQEIQRVSPELRVIGIVLQSTLIEETLLSERLLAWLSGFFALVAVMLAAVGLYGVLSYSVVRRTREIGIRVALGACQLGIARLVLAGAAMPLACGVGAGLAGGLALVRLISSFLFQVKPSDFWSLALPVMALLIAVALAALPPAIRAARVDPMTVLRHE